MHGAYDIVIRGRGTYDDPHSGVDAADLARALVSKLLAEGHEIELARLIPLDYRAGNVTDLKATAEQAVALILTREDVERRPTTAEPAEPTVQEAPEPEPPAKAKQSKKRK